MAGQHRADHHHRGAKADAFGNVAMVADAAVGNDRLGGHARAPLQRRQLPAASAKAGFELGDAHLAGANAHLGGVGAPVFQVDDRFRRADVAGNHKRGRQLFLQVHQHVAQRVGMAMRNVDGDVLGNQAGCGQLVHRGVVGFFDAQRNGRIDTARPHVAHKLHVVQVKAVHHVEVTVLCHPHAKLFVDDCFHVGRHDRQAKRPATELHAGIALCAALHAALARQQKNVVVVKDFHEFPSSIGGAAKRFLLRWALGLPAGWCGQRLKRPAEPCNAQAQKNRAARNLGPVRDSTHAPGLHCSRGHMANACENMLRQYVTRI